MKNPQLATATAMIGSFFMQFEFYARSGTALSFGRQI